MPRWAYSKVTLIPQPALLHLASALVFLLHLFPLSSFLFQTSPSTRSNTWSPRSKSPYQSIRATVPIRSKSNLQLLLAILHCFPLQERDRQVVILLTRSSGRDTPYRIQRALLIVILPIVSTPAHFIPLKWRIEPANSLNFPEAGVFRFVSPCHVIDSPSPPWQIHFKSINSFYSEVIFFKVSHDYPFSVSTFSPLQVWSNLTAIPKCQRDLQYLRSIDLTMLHSPRWRCSQRYLVAVLEARELYYSTLSNEELPTTPSPPREKALSTHVVIAWMYGGKEAEPSTPPTLKRKQQRHRPWKHSQPFQ